MKNKIALIGAASGWGAGDRRTGKGPEALRAWGLDERLQEDHLAAHWADMVETVAHEGQVHIHTREDTYPLVLEQCQKLAECVEVTLHKHEFPVVIGGDHSIAMGTWSGIITALKAQQKFGLIWFDAHMDAHTPETAHQGAWGGHYHGQPLAHLLGQGDKDLQHIASAKTKLAPQHVVLVGIRSFEPGEAALLKKLKVRVIFMEEVLEKGIDWALDEALKIASKAPGGFGMTIDLDGFDPADAPGVGTPESVGVKAAQALPGFARIGAHPNFKALEITEYNPARDSSGKTAELTETLIATIAGAAVGSAHKKAG